MRIGSSQSQFLLLLVVLFGLVWNGTLVEAQGVPSGKSASEVRPSSVLQFRKWSGSINVPDPVSISFDDQGRAFVTQTTRRKIQDLDIREHRSWIPNDVSFRSVQDKVDFYRARLAVPEGADSRNVNRSQVKDVNEDGLHDFRDLQVLSEKIHWLEDADGDGTADHIGLFAEGFNTEVTGIAAGVLAHQGDVYTTIAPDVWRLRDTDGDGTADQREIMATGFGMHIAYAGHDMHGLTVGPDGRIYWSVGDKGVNIRSREGKSYEFPNQGAVLRCNPDGSDLEVFAHGLRNVQELAFDQYGNLFGFDNDSDQPNERERFVWIVEGLDAGWRCNYQYRGGDYNPWMAERMWEPHNADQPAYIVPPIVNSINGPCGFAFNPGTALSPDYKDYFFLTGTIKGEQIAFQIMPNGDAFEMANVHTFGAGTPLIGINFSPNGGLYAVDWGGGYPLNQKGAVWEIDVEEYRQSALRIETAELIRLDYAKIEKEKLIELLYHADQRVRLKAQFEMVARNLLTDAMGVADASAKTEHECSVEARRLARVHSIWAVGQLLRAQFGKKKSAVRIDLDPAIERMFKALLRDMDPIIRVQAAKILADLPKIQVDTLAGCLRDENQHVQVQAALSIGRRGDVQAFNQLVDLAARARPDQPYLRHAISAGLAGIAIRQIHSKLEGTGEGQAISPAQLRRLATHEKKQVRLAGVVALRKMSIEFGNDPRVQIGAADFLTDADTQVVTEAARAIYDDFSIMPELNALAKRLEKAAGMPEALVRRAIGANFRLGGEAELKRVANFGLDEAVNLELRLEAIDAVSDWNTPAPLDRVTGRFRGKGPMTAKVDPSFARQVDVANCRTQLLKLVDSKFPPIQSAAIRALRDLSIGLPFEKLVTILQSDLAAELRIESLNSIASMSSGNERAEVVAQVKAAFKSDEPSLKRRALEWLAKLEPEEAIMRIERVAEVRGKRSKEETRLLQTALTLLGEIGTDQSDQCLSEIFESMLKSDGQFPGSVTLEILEAAEIRSKQNQRFQQLLNRFENQRTSDDISLYTECSTGGDPGRGKQIFNTNLTAQCVRCHRVGNKGSTVGPNLKGVASRQPAMKDPDYLLRSIVAPSADIDEKYQTMMFLLLSGETVQGVIVRENKDSIVVADATGKETEIPVDDIDFEKKQELSTMPEPKGLSKREIRDLVAYLKTLKKK